jgi:hypothetical protein
MGARKMVLKHELPKSIPLHIQGLNYGANIYELEDNVGEKGWSLNWPTKLGHAKNIPLANFLNRLLKNT